MITIRLYNPIANADNSWWYCWGEDSGVFSLKYIKKVFEENPNETDFKFNIHCNGGEVEEGLAIYDFLRTSGKNLFMNIEGGCHSMALTLLLAAPKENRSANPNAVALMHEVQGYAGGSTSEVTSAAKDMQMLQNRILDIYADRTGYDRDALEAMMKEQREHNASELLQLGFVSKINSYNTNYKFNTMAKKEQTLIEKAGKLLNKFQNLLGGAPLVNYDFTDDEGNVLFSTEEDDDTLEVGMSASPDGTFTIKDGRTITIAEGVITDIQEAEGGDDTTPEGEDGNACGDPDKKKQDDTDTNSRITALEKENKELKNAAKELSEMVLNLRKELKSTYVPANRIGGPKGKSNPAEERKNELRENFKIAQKKK